jgi:hypothetical protein
MSGLPHQVQRVMDIQVDTSYPLRVSDLNQFPKVHATYVKVPGLRNHRWTKVKMTDVILVSAKRHQWREEIQSQIDWLCKDEGDDQ